MLPGWVDYIDGSKREVNAVRENGPADRLSGETLAAWVHDTGDVRVAVEAATLGPPWTHPEGIGEVLTIDNVIGAQGQEHLDGGVARDRMIAAVDAGGAAWLIAGGATQLYARRIEEYDGEWTATSGITRDDAPGAVIGGLVIGAADAEILRQGIRTEDERARRYLRILECWWRGEGYQVRVERLHDCAQCPHRHWTTSRLHGSIYTREDADGAAERERVEAAPRAAEWTTLPVKANTP